MWKPKIEGSVRESAVQEHLHLPSFPNGVAQAKFDTAAGDIQSSGVQVVVDMSLGRVFQLGVVLVDGGKKEVMRGAVEF